MKKVPNRTLTRAEATAATGERIVRGARRLFFDRRYEDVTLNEIAAAAGVSHQTVLNHFESKEGVAFAMAELVRDETASVRFDVRPGDARGALKALVDEYERMGDLNIRMLTSALDVERLAEILGMARRSHRLWIETVFANSLPSPKKARERAINSIYAATDVYVWKLLRRDLGLSRDETQRVMTDLVLGVINARRP